MNNKLSEEYKRLKQYASIVEEVCQDVKLRGYGFGPGVLFTSEYGFSLDLPEWFLERLYNYMAVQQPNSANERKP